MNVKRATIVKKAFRKSSEESHGNSTSSGFSSAQQSPQDSSSLAAYENFLIVDDDLGQSREQSIGRRVCGNSSRCTGVLRLNDEIILEAETSRSPSQINTQFDNHSAASTSRANPPSLKYSFWNRMRVITSAVTLRQQPFQPFAPSPSGSLLPNTALPNSATIAALKQQTPKQLRTAEELHEERRQRIRRYVYISQGALILIVALVWLASNFVDLKVPNRPNQSNQSKDGNERLGPTISALDHGMVADVVTHSTTHSAELGEKSELTFDPLTRHSDINPNLTNSIRPSDIDNAISGNSIDEQEEMTTPASSLRHIYASEMYRSDDFKKLLSDSKVPTSDMHKIRKRWRNRLRSLNLKI
ncbi:unnamed protein product [Toxocara canis]|uniref:LEM domain-containing protein n=1 Tax=Toxocara canis TaxID=6265 RepID=A0A183U0F7_TOXCA|nr:unnamed protein product [Toxocara canis]